MHQRRVNGGNRQVADDREGVAFQAAQPVGAPPRRPPFGRARFDALTRGLRERDALQRENSGPQSARAARCKGVDARLHFAPKLGPLLPRLRQGDERGGAEPHPALVVVDLIAQDPGLAGALHLQIEP